MKNILCLYHQEKQIINKLRIYDSTEFQFCFYFPLYKFLSPKISFYDFFQKVFNVNTLFAGTFRCYH